MKRLLILIGLALLLAPAGCGGGAGGVSGGQVALTPDNSAGYLDRISAQPTLTEAEAVEGILLLLDQQRKMTFAEAVKLLTGRKIAPGGWDWQAQRPMTRGRTAHMVYQACNIKGGLTLTLTGPSPRYCLRELQYRGYMAPGLPYNKVTGMEYVAVLTRADELRQTGKVSSILIREGGSP